MNAWTTQYSVEHIVAPAESHRLSLVERRHTTLRRAIEIYMDDMKVSGSKGIRQALTYVVPQLNDTVSVAGYTPSQCLERSHTCLVNFHMMNSALHSLETMTNSNNYFDNELQQRKH